jgi:hypothetical protein
VAILNGWRRGFAAGRGRRDLVLLLTVAFLVFKILLWPLYLWVFERSYAFLNLGVEFWIASFTYFSCVGVVLNSGIRSARLRRIGFAFSGDLLIAALLVTVAITLEGPKVQGSLTANSGHLPLLLWIAAFLEFTRAVSATSALGRSSGDDSFSKSEPTRPVHDSTPRAEKGGIN